MGQINNHLRRAETGISHWCDGCQEMHLIPDNWQFNGDYNKPTFTPSVKISSVKITELGEHQYRDFIEKGIPIPNGKLDSYPHVCHYILTDGVIHYCGDCTHSLKGQKRPLPLLPAPSTVDGR